MKEIEYYILDVFAKNKYEGNQLAVYLDLDDDLTKEEMLQIAKEINFAESTFIKKKIEDNKFSVKIFTAESEIPFAGHPTIGTSYIIAKYLMNKIPKEVILKLTKDEIRVTLSKEENLEKCLFQMTQSQPEYLKTFSSQEIANQLGIDISLISIDKPIQEISTGLPYIIVPIKDLESIGKINLSPIIFKDFLISNKIYKSNSPKNLSTSLFFYTDQTYESANDFNTRMFCLENEKLIEDSATGSANGCFLAYLLKHMQKDIIAKVEQGFQMNRKSYLYLEGKENEGYYDLKIGGYSKLISKGKWLLD